MHAIEHHDIRVNGVTLHYAAAGEPDAPLVVLLHGFPECWYSWRHQLPALAAAGYRVVAPDQRGFARSDAPAAVEAYSLPHLVGDVVALTRELGADRFAVVGHDWGAPVAWQTALFRPDLVRGVVGLSVTPPFPRQGDTPPLAVMDALFEGRFYWNYFCRPGLADAEFAADPARTFRSFLYGASGDNPRNDPQPAQPLTQPDGTFLGHLDDTKDLPAWLSDADIAVFVAEYEKNGFTGGLNWYRNLDRNWELSAAWDRLPLLVPGRYITGDRDLVGSFPGMQEGVAALPLLYPALQPTLTLPGCGHWTQQERPAEVNAALLEFLAGLPA
ncbi:alpha/beta fold hydrolase [Streptacidiphilus jiangxiensis]|uniref:Pimeloyl-ACP methyl ester carboxylesterase n=1 Tax=Streptacidiphilus jiangxiensis TaxID=235985 RepID=A0A1H7XBF0_STRJI|nr:alpha/beta hydrolase [Streptacidiphilus jiangxiensis]SEM31130.1 Pimeloyl-ACP methyl ester carboxylesterase [Streptacidiphilus jiangxiensis]